MPFLTTILRRSGDYWVALCLENGVVSQGSTKEEALAKIREANASMELRALHNHHLSFPDTDLLQNEGFATIDPWIPPNFLGGESSEKDEHKICS